MESKLISRRHASFLSLLLLLTILRFIFPERPLDVTGPRAFLDAFFAIGLLGLLAVLSGGIGWKLLSRLKLAAANTVDPLLFSVPLGLGVVAYGVYFLGLAGLFNPWAILAWLLLLMLLSWRDIDGFLEHLVRELRRIPKGFSTLGVGEKAVSLLGGLILAASAINALAPPAEYDSLMYHLQAPRLFLQAGRITLLPDVWQANGPFAVQMLFSIGMAFGSDTFARLLHLSLAVMLVLAAFRLGDRYLGRRQAWVAVAILLGAPRCRSGLRGLTSISVGRSTNC